MTASRLSPLRIGALGAGVAIVIAIAACARGDRAATPLVTVTGDFLADGSCRALVSGAALFTPGDRPHTTYDAGPVADIAPAGYTIRQLACAPAGARGHAGEPTVLVTLYARAGAPLHAGRYDIRAALATSADSVGPAARAGVAVFGAPSMSSSGAGVRYLEGRSGTLTITSADADRVVGAFSMRAAEAWSM